jgi:glycosyltransferase involved in cell wall biosynthesis
MITQGTDLIVLHGGWVPENIIVGSYARRRGLPYLVTAHGVYHPRVLGRRKVALKRAWNVLLERRHLSNALAVHCFFSEERDYLRRLGVDVAVVAAPNGFSAPVEMTWRGCGEGDLVWLGRFDPECKGLDLLLAAMRLLSVHERPRLALHGPDWHGQKRSVARLNAELALEEWVTLGEAVYGDQKRHLLESAAGFVYPSRWEAFGFSVVEAVSLGIPTLVTPYPLGRFLAAQGGAVLAELTAPALADGLRRLRAPETIQTGKRGAEIVREALSWDVVARSWLEQVQTLMSRGG